MKDGYSYPNKSNLGLIWGSLWPIIVWLGIQMIVIIVFTVVYMLLSDMNAINDVNDFLNKNAMIMTFIYQIISLLVFVPIYLYNKKYMIKPLDRDKNDYKLYIVCGLIIVSIGIISGFFVEYLDSIINIKDGGLETINNILFSSNIIIEFLSIVLLAPIVEEILFRGLVFNRINSKWNSWIAIFISAILFGVAHGNIIQGLNAFILGIVLAYFYNKYHILWICIIGHFFNNLLSFVFTEFFFANKYFSIGFQLVILIITILISVIYYKKNSIKIRE